MSSAIWTVIMIQGNTYKSVYEYASRETEAAKKEIENKHAGYAVVAMILGRHTGVYTFDLNSLKSYEHLDRLLML